MGLWLINADTLAGGRFVISPLSETVACLKLLDRGAAANPAERTWLAAHLEPYRDRLADDPVTALLIKSALGRRWNADFLTRTPSGDQRFHEELAGVRETPSEVVRADLLPALERPVPQALRHEPDLGARAADLLEWVWTNTVQPYWERRRRIFEADAVARTGRLSQGGWAAALNELRPGMRWLGGGRLQINMHDYPPREIHDAQLLFVPVTPRRGWVTWDHDRRYAIIYPCTGPLAETDRTPVPEALGRLLGTHRATVLVLLDTPKSTTQLVALTGQTLGSVGRHLKILLDAGLTTRQRSGRSVLYTRTPTGNTVVACSAMRLPG